MEFIANSKRKKWRVYEDAFVRKWMNVEMKMNIKKQKKEENSIDSKISLLRFNHIDSPLLHQRGGGSALIPHFCGKGRLDVTSAQQCSWADDYDADEDTLLSV